MKIRQATQKILAAVSVAVAVSMVFPVGTADAATYYACTDHRAASNDSGGVFATATLDRSDGGNSCPELFGDYVVNFLPYGEHLQVWDRVADGHAAVAEVRVLAGTRVIDFDRFYVSTADDGDDFNLGTPDGSGDVAEGYKVNVRVCINETSRCTPWSYGVA